MKITTAEIEAELKALDIEKKMFGEMGCGESDIRSALEGSRILAMRAVLNFISVNLNSEQIISKLDPKNPLSLFEAKCRLDFPILFFRLGHKFGERAAIDSIATQEVR